MRTVVRRFVSLALTFCMVVPSLFVSVPVAMADTVTPGTPYQAGGTYDVTVPHVEINQVYGGYNPSKDVIQAGTNNVSSFKDKGQACSNSFIELYNPTDSDVNLDGWSVQLSSSLYYNSNLPVGIQNGKWAVLPLSGTIHPHSSFLVRGAATGSTAPFLTISNRDQDWAMPFNTKGTTVALLSTTTTLTTNVNPFDNTTHAPSVSGYVDMLGASGNDSTADERIFAYEGSYTWSQSKQKAIRRMAFTDTDNNATVDDAAYGQASDAQVIGYNTTDNGFIQWAKPRYSGDGAWAASAMPPAAESTRLSTTTPNCLTNAFGTDAKTTRTFTWEMPSGFATGGVEISTAADLSNSTLYASTVTTADGGTATTDRVSVTGLNGGQTYYYRAENGSAVSPIYSFTTEDPNDNSFSFLHVSDTQADVDTFTASTILDYQTFGTALTAMNNAYHPNFLLETGDLIDTQNSEDQWRWYFKRAGNVLANTALMPTIGNHEQTTAYPASSFREHFTVPNQCTDPAVTPGTVYSFDYGNAHFVVLNTENKGAGFTAQYNWADADMSATNKKFIIVALHRGPYEGTGMADTFDAFGSLLDKHNVALVLQGHEHCYYRVAAMRNGQIATDGNGTVSLETGGSGAKQDNAPPLLSYMQVATTPGSPCYSVITVNDRKISIHTAVVRNPITSPSIVDLQSSGATITPSGATVDFDVVAAPTGLAAGAASSSSASDGKITGTTAEMEYEATGTSTWTTCGDTETDGLAAGVYAVRYKGAHSSDTLHEAIVTVPVQVTHTITTSAGAHGTIGDSATVLDGATATVTITPDSGYYLSGLLVDGVATAPVAPYVFSNVTSDHTIAASFSALAPVETFDHSPALASIQTPGAWFTDRYAPAGFGSAFFDGDRRLKLSISSADSQDNRPAAYSGTFYNTQGRDYAIATSTVVAGDLYVGSDWTTDGPQRRSDLWASGVDNGGAVTGWPIIGFKNDVGFRCWDNNGWHVIGFPEGFSTGKWYSLRMQLNADSVSYYIDGKLVYVSTFADDPDMASCVGFNTVMLQAYNFGQSYDVYWDNVVPVPAANGPALTVPSDIATDAPAAGTVVDFQHASATDALGGALVPVYAVDGTPIDASYVFPAGTTTVTVRATDAWGNTADGSFKVTVTGHAAPVTTISTLPMGWVNHDVAFTLTPASDLPVVTNYLISPSLVAAVSTAGTVTAEGTNTIAYWSVDSLGQTETHNTATVKIDKTAPAINGAATTLPNAAGWYNHDVTVHFSAADALSGVASVTGDTLLSAEGTGLSASGNATDNAGNAAAKTVSGISIDKTAPSVPGAPEYSALTTSQVDLQWGASTDALSGVDHYDVYDGATKVATVQSAETTLAVTPNSTHSYTVVAVDAAGNASAASSSLSVNVASGLRILSPAMLLPGYNKSVTISVNLIDSQSQPVSKKTVALEMQTAGGGWTAVATMKAGLNGVYTAKVVTTTRTLYRAHFAGDSSDGEAIGGTIIVLPKASISLPKLSVTRPASGTPFAISGTLLPAHSGKAYVTLELQVKSGSVWVAAKTLQVTVPAHSSAYSATTTLTKGSYRVRAVHSDFTHAYTATSYKAFTCK